MLYIPNYSNDPADNLAYEQYLLEEVVKDEPLLYFYINKPSVIIGRHQNTYEQVNLDYLFKNNIEVVRRMSGGGAVYHDYGNLNYSFILPSSEYMLNFDILTKPIIEALKSMGANDIRLSGRNDIEIDGFKVSGTAMYQKGEKILLHGTLLYNSDLSNINNILKVKKDKIESKGVKSVRSRVTNLSPYLDEEYQNLSTTDFMHKLMDKMKDVHHSKETIELEVLRKINQIKVDYYINDYWNFGRSMDWTYRNRHKFDFGEVEMAISVDNNIVKDFKIYGDYFAKKDIETLEESFIGLTYDLRVFEEQLNSIKLKEFLPAMNNQEFLNLCFEN